ncbi:hypothetical protein ABH922_001854 [Rhodococcus sp. 27YEA15]|uniref:hypothetical protein n=1 Tax=Rhodococcus sp. 27YEA15 TaxID=3156259 RepID=UPI003C7D07F3
MTNFIPSTPRALAEQIVELCECTPSVALVAVDGADCAQPHTLAAVVATAALDRQRPSAVVSVHDYIRPASLRLEFGHDDALSYRTLWFDYSALDREVITAARSRGTWLPRLWDERTDRSARAERRTVHERQVIVVAGPMLLGRGLDFDVTVRLDMSEAALRRRTAGSDQWTVDALLEHRRSVSEQVDVEVKYDHPDRPAVQSAFGR